MRKRLVRLRPVPMAGSTRNEGNVAGFHGQFTIIAGHESATERGDEELIAGMAMWAIARSVSEGYRRYRQRLGRGRGDDFLYRDSSNENRIVGRFAEPWVEMDYFDASHAIPLAEEAANRVKH